jgi:hypothetical protein
MMELFTILKYLFLKHNKGLRIHYITTELLNIHIKKCINIEIKKLVNTLINIVKNTIKK